MVNITSDLTGKELGPYKVEELIGRGGMAAVYRAFHPATDRQVAIKVMLPKVATDKVFKRRFEREAKTLARLQHIHILPVFDYGEQDGVSYLVMPYLPGSTLGDRIAEGRMPIEEVCTIFRQLAIALDYAHKQGVLHCDLKPHNVMFDSSGNAVLADFGLTRLLDRARLAETITLDSNITGTPAYMSPEQGQGDDLDHRSDLYSLTVMLFEMLTGEVPYTAKTPVALIYKHVHEDVPSINRTRHDLPLQLQDVVQRGMAKAPEDRFNAASEIADALDALVLGPPTPRETIRLPKAKRQRSDGEMSTTQAAGLRLTNVHQALSTVIDGLQLKRKRGKRGLVGLAAVTVITVVVLGLVLALRLRPGGQAAQQVIAAHDAPILDVAVNADGTQLITGSEDDTARVWDLETAEQLLEIESHSSNVVQVGIRPDDALYATSETLWTYAWFEDGDIAAMNLVDASVGVMYSSDSALEVAVAPNVVFVMYSWTGTEREDRIERFEMNTPTVPEAAFNVPVTVESPADAEFTAAAMSSVVLPGIDTEDGRERFQYALLTGDSAGNLTRWRVWRDAPFESADEVLEAGFEANADYRYVTVEQEAATRSAIGGVTALAVAPDGETFAAANGEGQVFIGVLDTLATQHTLPGEHDPITDLAYSPDARLLAVAPQANDVLMYDLTREDITTQLSTEGSQPTALAFTRAGRLVVGADDGRVYIWDLAQPNTTAMHD